jgi:hypothetical protein
MTGDGELGFAEHLGTAGGCWPGSGQPYARYYTALTR